MKRKIIKTICRKKYYGIITAVSSGFFVIISLVCLCGICMTKVDLPDMAIYALMCFSLGMGGYCSGVISGKNKRHNGIVNGFKCGLCLWGIISVFGVVYMRDFPLAAVIKNFVFLCIPSVIGGIYGVNSKIKKIPY